MTRYHQTSISRLLHEALLRLCTESVPFEDKLEVDGIICLSHDNGSQQIVVKVHEVLENPKCAIIEPEAVNGLMIKKTGVNSAIARGIAHDLKQKDTDSENEALDLTCEKENTAVDSDWEMAPGSRKRRKCHPHATVIIADDNSDSSDSYDGAPLKIPKPTSLTLPELEETPVSLPSQQIVPTVKKKMIKSPHSLDNISLTCRFCSVSQPGFNALYNHQLEWHKRYTCRFCFNTFSMKCNLRRHERMHVGNKIQCKYCEKTFTRNHDLKFHELKHHNESLSETVRNTYVSNDITLNIPNPLESRQTELSAKDNAMLGGLRISFVEKPGVAPPSEDYNNDLDLNALQPIIIKPDTPKTEIPAPKLTENLPENQTCDTSATPWITLDSVARSESPLSKLHVNTTGHLIYPASSVMSMLSNRWQSQQTDNSTPLLTIPTPQTSVSLSPKPLESRHSPSPGAKLSPHSKTHKNSVLQKVSNGTKDDTKRSKSASVSDVVDASSQKSHSPPMAVVKVEAPAAHVYASDKALMEVSALIKTFTCNICSLTCSSLEQLDEHSWTRHMRYSCPVCVQTFSNRNNRARHVRSHTGEREYSCRECGKTFSRSDTLKEHQIIHTDGYIVQQCTYCGEKIDKKAALLNHIKKCSASHKRAERNMAFPQEKSSPRRIHLSDYQPSPTLSVKVEKPTPPCQNNSVFSEPIVVDAMDTGPGEKATTEENTALGNSRNKTSSPPTLSPAPSTGTECQVPTTVNALSSTEDSTEENSNGN